jgi:hypothetical protein
MTSSRAATQYRAEEMTEQITSKRTSSSSICRRGHVELPHQRGRERDRERDRDRETERERETETERQRDRQRDRETERGRDLILNE